MELQQPDESRLGAWTDGRSTTFRVLSRHADGIELCLFERPDSASAARRFELVRRSEDLWSVTVDDAGPGTLYGYRVRGRWAPQDGHVFNPAKLLLDPWARAITGEPRDDPSLFGFRPGSSTLDSTDSAAAMPKCVVVGQIGEAERAEIAAERPRTPWRETVIYEAHVRGMTMRHPEVDPALRGTFLGLVQEPVLAHLRSLGVTAVELMPVFQCAPEEHLLRLGLRNYWGYATVGFFAPDASLATDKLGGQVDEFRAMVRALHRAGFEVLLDVVYNHTPEGGLRGPVYSLKGLDQQLFYRLDPRNPRRHVDWTGCGNTLDAGRGAIVDLILDSLRTWVTDFGVDGFRFDLAPALGRDGSDFTPEARLFEAMAADPAFADVKWIAEPWDLGPGGYRLGQFPAGWGEWNDRFRDAARRFWRGDGGSDGAGGELIARLGGSADLFGARGPAASVHFVAAHDGFTLADLTSYERKHNEKNGENNRDGSDHNLSRNWGVEGPADDPAILDLRARHRRNLLTQVFLARGVPLLGHGDEIGRTQGGNNNAYCQDDETTWVDWSRLETSERDQELLRFVRGLSALRRRFPALCRDACLPFPGERGADGARWLGTDGADLSAGAAHGSLVSFALLLPPADGGEGLLWLLHGGTSTCSFRLPDEVRSAGRVRGLLDTVTGSIESGTLEAAPETWTVEPLGQVLLAWGDPLP